MVFLTCIGTTSCAPPIAGGTARHDVDVLFVEVLPQSFAVIDQLIFALRRLWPRINFLHPQRWRVVQVRKPSQSSVVLAVLFFGEGIAWNVCPASTRWHYLRLLPGIHSHARALSWPLLNGLTV